MEQFAINIINKAKLIKQKLIKLKLIKYDQKILNNKIIIFKD